MRAVLLLLAFATAQVTSFRFRVTQEHFRQQRCTGMYGGQSTDDHDDSRIHVHLDDTLPPSPKTGNVSIVVFELQDERLAGYETSSGKIESHCTQENVDAKYCSIDQLGQSMVNDEALKQARNPIVAKYLPLSDPISFMYPVNNPGYYCVAASARNGTQFTLDMDTIDRNLPLPPFRHSTLTMFSWIAPTAILLLIAWFFVRPARARSLVPTSFYVLLWLATATCFIRWATLATFDQHVGPVNSSPILLALSKFMLIGQDILLVIATITAVSHYLDRDISRRVEIIIQSCFAVAFALANLVDVRTTDGDKSPALASVLLGMLLAAASFAAASMLLRIGKTSSAPHQRPRRILLIGLAVYGTCCALLVLINAYRYMFSPSSGPEFGSQYWKGRSLWMDLPFELPNLLLIIVLAVQFVTWTSETQFVLQAEDEIEIEDYMNRGVTT